MPPSCLINAKFWAMEQNKLIIKTQTAWRYWQISNIQDGKLLRIYCSTLSWNAKYVTVRRRSSWPICHHQMWPTYQPMSADKTFCPPHKDVGQRFSVGKQNFVCQHAVGLFIATQTCTVPKALVLWCTSAADFVGDKVDLQMVLTVVALSTTLFTPANLSQTKTSIGCHVTNVLYPHTCIMGYTYSSEYRYCGNFTICY